MVKLRKRASKRVAIAQREKIKKKVREHGRKVKKDAKKNPQWKSKLKKDPGIPNSFPYKEQLLDEIETKRRIAEEEKQAARQAKLAERRAAKERGNDVEQDGESQSEDEEADEHDISAMLTAEPVPLVAPLFRGSVQELFDSDEINTFIFTLDARDPQSFRSLWFESQAAKRNDKKMALVLSRADLVPAETLTSWIAYLSMSTKLAVFPTSIHPETSQVEGVEQLVESLGLKGEKKGDVAVIGMSHSGRTTIADAILNVIGQPEDQDDEEENSDWPAVLDTPALIAVNKVETAQDSDDEGEEDEEEEEEEEEDDEEKQEEKMVERMELRCMQTLMRNQGQVQRIKEPLPLVWALISRISHPEDLMLIYNLPAFGSFVPSKASLADEELDEDEKEMLIARQLRAKIHADSEEFLVSLARATGRMKRKNMPDPVGASRVLLRDWAQQTLGYYTQAPKLTNAIQALQDAKVKVAALNECVSPRKDWRKRLQARELRLKPISMVLGREALVLDKVKLSSVPVDQDDDDDDDEDDDEEDQGEMEEDDDEEQEPKPKIQSKTKQQLKSILKKAGSLKRSADEQQQQKEKDGDKAEAGDDDGDDDEEEKNLSRKTKRLLKKVKTVTPKNDKAAVATNKVKQPTTTKKEPTKKTTTVEGPAPGEKYDFGAFF